MGIDRTDRYDDVDDDASVGGFDANFVEVDGVRTRYYDEGDGEPIVLIHGGSWTGFASANTWTTNLGGLSRELRVIAPDRLGNGMTDNPETPAEYVYSSELEHMAEFIRTLGFEEVHLAGQSRGGGLAGRLAVEYPEMVKTVTIVNSSTLAPEAGDYAFRRGRMHLGEPDDPDSPTYYEDMYRHLEEMMSYSTDHVTDEYVRAGAYMRSRPKAMETAEVLGGDPEQPYWRRDDSQNQWLDSLQDHMIETHNRIVKGEFTVPTLIYWAVNDPTLPLRAGIALYDMLIQHNPDVRMYTVNRAGHHPYREHPEEFDRMVPEFIGTFGP